MAQGITQEALGKLLREMLDKHGLQNWKAGFVCSTIAFGLTQFETRPKGFSGELEHEVGILISPILAALSPLSVVEDVILHEIAHAKLINEYLPRLKTMEMVDRYEAEMKSVCDHSDIWKLTYLAIGGSGMENCEQSKHPIARVAPTWFDMHGIVATEFIGEKPEFRPMSTGRGPFR